MDRSNVKASPFFVHNYNYYILNKIDRYVCCMVFVVRVFELCETLLVLMSSSYKWWMLDAWCEKTWKINVYWYVVLMHTPLYIYYCNLFDVYPWLYYNTLTVHGVYIACSTRCNTNQDVGDQIKVELIHFSRKICRRARSPSKFRIVIQQSRERADILDTRTTENKESSQKPLKQVKIIEVMNLISYLFMPSTFAISIISSFVSLTFSVFFFLLLLSFV